ncbi:2-oxo acid dehydrogenase subunit E2 [Cryobacterium sp. Y11]|uniref:2-oxo acid dehydrogenase subunit E2 n=1 Tax=Cryobacterium sp. Y11 TaxID=2045016 RepID=UPI000CE4EB16|nr:2-oxo acid dehydrogenase subunit E2 [Cryobacterium sp. Y11]
MATIIRMPEVLANSSEAAIQTWLVKLGEEVAFGTPLAEVETEKAIVEYAAETAGTVLKLLVEEGVSVKVGVPIAVVGAQGENIDGLVTDDARLSTASAAAPAPAAAPSAPPEPETAPSPVVSAPTELSSSAASPGVSGDRQFVSPLVRRLAKERGLDLSAVDGSGPGGRIVRRDIEGLIAAPAAIVPAPAQGDDSGADIPHTAMRRAIARRLTESKSTVPHFYLVADCRVDKLIALRASVNESAPVKVSLNDFVLKAATAAFLDVPEAHATWGGTAITRYTTVDMSVAVAVDGGLVTPVLRSVERQTLTEVARNVADLAERARGGRLKQHELEGGSFTVSNLGSYGVTEFSAIINPPQSAILAVGLATQRAIVVDGAIEVGTIMTVTMSADHRVLDGALAAQWLAAFVARIENPIGMLV